MAGGLVIFSTLPAVGAAVTARSADSFVDSMGINTHYSNSRWWDSPFHSPETDKKLGELGLRHIRDNLWNDEGITRITGLYNTYGIRTNLVLTDAATAPQEIANIVGQVPAIGSVEGINEPDGHPATYKDLTDDVSSDDYAATRAFQRDLYSALKSNPQTAHLPVLSPAMMDPGKGPLLSGSGFDVAAMHSYPWNRKPSFRVDESLYVTRMMGEENIPVVSTETGYHTSAPNGDQVSEVAAAKYIPRLFAEYFNRGIARTYAYELIDGLDDPANPEANFGLLRNDGSPKPAYDALKNLIDLLEEPGADFTPQSLDYALSTSEPTVQHTLLQKSDGTFYLLLWNDVESWDMVEQLDIEGDATVATLDLGAHFQEARLYVPGEGAGAVATFVEPDVLELNVRDQIMVLELRNQHMPEPAGLAVALLGLGWFGSRRRRG